MNKCKFCEAELDEGALVCPACGKQQQESACEETCQEAMPCDCGGDCDCKCDEAKPKKGWKIGILIAAGVVLLGVLTGAVLYGLGIDLRPKANNVSYKDNYTVEDAVLDEKGNTVVATVGDRQLNNAQLQIYYWTHVYDFLDYYASYGVVDTTKDLHEQTWEDDMTTQQFFLDMALQAWHETQVLCALAEESNYVMPEDLQAEIDALPDGLKEMLGTDYKTVEEMLRAQLFPGVTEEGYLKYVSDYYYGYSYLETVREGFVPTDDQVAAYFTEHEEGYKENGITKETMRADVRHILLAPENGTTNDAGVTTYTEDAWAACLVKAQALLDDWKKGAATEASFAELANTHSVDGGSNTTGGLYTNITPDTNFVPNFLNWAIDPNRQIGDTGIVQSDFGYHIMYYVGGEPIWKETVMTDYITEKTQALMSEGTERWPLKVNFKEIALGYMSLS